METTDSAIKDFVLSMARSAYAANSLAEISVPNIVSRCGGNARIVRHVLADLEAKKVIQVTDSYQGDAYFTVHFPSAEDLGVNELKERARAIGYTMIKRQSGNASAVPLSGWNGVSTETETAYMHTLVTYTLDGDKVVAHKRGEKDIEYILS